MKDGYCECCGEKIRSNTVWPKRDEIVARYCGGETLVQIAAALDISMSAVQKTLVKMGVPIRPKGFPKGKAPWGKLPDDETLAEHRRLGWTYQRIADRYGVTRQAVHLRLSR